MISFVNVTKDYQLDEQTLVTPVSNVNLEVKQGELILIIGRSGSGKTTLLNLAAGLVHPTSGKVLVDGVDLWGLTDNEVSSFRSRKIGFVFQFPSLLPTLTVAEMVVPTFFGPKDQKDGALKRARDILEMLGLADRMIARPKQLSGGEQKRVVIARALINRPGLLLADEPTSDLDAQTEQEIMGLFRGIQASGITIVMVTHSLELIPYASRAFRMASGVLSEVSGTRARQSSDSKLGSTDKHDIKFLYGN